MDKLQEALKGLPLKERNGVFVYEKAFLAYWWANREGATRSSISHLFLRAARGWVRTHFPK